MLTYSIEHTSELHRRRQRCWPGPSVAFPFPCLCPGLSPSRDLSHVPDPGPDRGLCLGCAHAHARGLDPFPGRAPARGSSNDSSPAARLPANAQQCVSDSGGRADGMS